MKWALLSFGALMAWALLLEAQHVLAAAVTAVALLVGLKGGKE